MIRCVPPAPGKEAEGNFRQAEAGGVGENADISRQNELGAATECVAIDGSDRWFVANFDTPENAMDDFSEFSIMRKPVARIQILDVTARYKGAITGAGEDDHANIIVAFEPLESGFEIEEGWHIEGIEHLRPIDRQDGNMIGSLHQDALRHIDPPLTQSPASRPLQRAERRAGTSLPTSWQKAAA